MNLVKSFLKISLVSSLAFTAGALVACNNGTDTGKAGTNSGGDNTLIGAGTGAQQSNGEKGWERI